MKEKCESAAIKRCFLLFAADNPRKRIGRAFEEARLSWPAVAPLSVPSAVSPAPAIPPLVSIVTSSFNQGRYLEQTLRSVLEQTYPRIEYIVMDGGSTDDSPALLRRYASRLAYWQSQKDNGFAEAIREGFRRSQGEILAYLNSDDLLAPDAVERAVEALRRQPDAVMIYGDRVCIDEHGQLLYYRPNLPFLSRSPYIAMIIAQESCFWRREAYFQVGGINTQLKFAVDYDLFSRLAKRGRIVHVGGLWGFFRKHPQSKTMTQYPTLGKQEGAAVQEALWGGRVRAMPWLTALAAVRLYALATMFMVRKPAWPPTLPQPRGRNVVTRYFKSLHETSWAKRAGRAVLGRYRS